MRMARSGCPAVRQWQATMGGPMLLYCVFRRRLVLARAVFGSVGGHCGQRGSKKASRAVKGNVLYMGGDLLFCMRGNGVDGKLSQSSLRRSSPTESAGVKLPSACDALLHAPSRQSTCISRIFSRSSAMKSLRKSLNGHKDQHITSPLPPLSKPLTAMQPPKKVIRALASHRANAPQELSFEKGDFFHVLKDRKSVV